ncbi:MAG: glycosyltransferase family 4 protein [Clostridia bacterium]
MKILYVTTIAATMGFFSEHIKLLQSQGHTVELACRLQDPLPKKILALGCAVHPLPFSRSPLNPDNLKAYLALKRLLRKERYDLIHTHTPNASAYVRLAARKLRRAGTKVIYTAHGLHFYKGAPLKNWLLFYPVEWLCAHWTDVLITINQEDYALAKRNLHAKKVVYVPGVGMDYKKFALESVERGAVRKSLSIPISACMCLSVGELNKNKNFSVVMRALAQLHDTNLHYCIAGTGRLSAKLHEEILTLGLEKQVHLLGYRSDVHLLCGAADIYCHPSFREGLPVSLMEAMAAGLACVVSNIRGNTDLIEEGKGGYLLAPDDAGGFARAITALADNAQLRRQMGAYNAKIIERFDTAHVNDAMLKVYQEVLNA